MRIRRRMRTTALLLATLSALACGCGGGTGADASAPLPPRAAVPPSPTSHVVIVVMENHEAGSVLGPGGMPYVKRLARRYGLATSSYAVGHPSLPNYLALVGGSTFGVTSNCTACGVRAPSIADQLEAHGISWRAYMEGMPRACFRGAESAGGYAKKHDPFPYFDGIARRPARCLHVVPLRQLAGDLRHGRLPAYAWITPSLCHDTHDCSLATGNRFLAGLVPPLLRGLGPDGFLILTWDEGDSNAGCCGGARGGHIATVVAGPGVRRGARLARPLDHYGVLATVERAFGLPLLRAARDPRHGSLDPLFRRPPRIA
jgi:phosphatidylinositol-3-phosphatase